MTQMIPDENRRDSYDDNKTAYYDLLTSVSENDLVDSWIARIRSTNSLCFLKILNQKGGIDPKVAGATMARSFTLQKTLHCKKLVTARKKSLHNGIDCLEYPYYNPANWQPLNAELLWSQYQILLPQIFQLIDYLHLMGVVHRDIKIENFLVTTPLHKPIVHLSDFDFLTKAGELPQGHIVGQPGFIPPEVMTNEGIYPESDIYSLGKSLSASLSTFLSLPAQKKTITEEQLEQLQRMLTSFCQEDRYNRPRTLLDSSLTTTKSNQPANNKERRRLLVIFLHSCLKEAPAHITSSQSKLARFARTKCRLFGLPKEVIHIHTEKEKQTRTADWKSFLNLLNASAITQYGDFWNVVIPKSSIKERFVQENGDLSTAKKSQTPQSILSDALTTASRYQQEEYYWYGLFCCETALTTLAKLSPAVDYQAPLLQRMVELTQQLYLLDTADEYLQTLALLKGMPPEEHLECMIKRAGVQIRMGKLTDAKVTAEQGLREATSVKSQRTLKLRQLLGWIEMSLGNSKIGSALLSETLDEARQHDAGKVIIQTLYSIGAQQWRQGKFSEAISFLEQSLREASERNLMHDALPALSTLAFVQCEQGNFSRGLNYCKQFLRTMNPNEHHSLIPSVYLSIIFAYVRMAKNDKAEFWLQRFLELGGVDKTPFHLHVYAQQQTFVKIAAGDIQGVRQWGVTAVQLGKQFGNQKTLGKTYHNLAETELMTAHPDICLEHVRNGKKLFLEIKDDASIAELELIEFAARRLYTNTGSAEQLMECIERLHTLHCTYYTALGYYYLFILFPDKRKFDIADSAKASLASVGTADVPLFSALETICECYNAKTVTSESEIFAWRQAFLKLNQTNQRFLALLCSRELIVLLKKNSRYRQAERYTTMSRAMSDGLGNHVLIPPQADVTHTPEGPNSDLISIFRAVSELMKNATDYVQTLDALLRFAVNQSGAERGVLFLSSSTVTGLRVIAEIGCDEQSQADAADISKSVVNLSLDSIQTLRVDNALNDPRTNRYRSIIKFNILSVIAVPLRLQNKLIGILYLDHHVIPSLFTDDDINYIETMANFIAQTLSTVQDIRVLRLDRDQLAEQTGAALNKPRLISADPRMQRLLEQLPRIAASNACVLLLGESGTGKELIAEEIHRRSDRARAPLIRLNCSAIPHDLIEITLFGAIRGAATGITAQDGRLRAADGGTLFLDEIGDMALHVQAKILRAIEQQEFNPVGSNRTIHTDIRFICATNKDLEQMIAEKTFREDLYHRITVIELEIPPLRERTNEIPLLLDHFLHLFGSEAAPQLTVEARTLLNCYTWPGNVRELKNFVERICIMHPKEIVDSKMLPDEMREIAAQRYNSQSAEVAERANLIELKRKTGGNQSEMARLSGIPLTTLRRKLRKYGLL